MSAILSYDAKTGKVTDHRVQPNDKVVLGIIETEKTIEKPLVFSVPIQTVTMPAKRFVITR